jgi:hypothetical protein
MEMVSVVLADSMVAHAAARVEVAALNALTRQRKAQKDYIELAERWSTSSHATTNELVD